VTKSGTQVKFAFEAAIWKEAIKRTFNLTKVFRQSDQGIVFSVRSRPTLMPLSAEFIDMLNQMRFGRLSQDSIRKFSNLKRPIDVSDGIQPTELSVSASSLPSSFPYPVFRFPRREDVERSNTLRMRALATQEITFTSKDGGTIQDPQQRDRLLANFMAPARLTIRIDAQVMLIKNTDDTLVNGSLGRVVGFADPDTFGTEPDQPGSGSGNKKVIPRAGIELYPVVEFAIGKSSIRKVLVQPETWKVELPNGEVQASRTQVQSVLLVFCQPD
jgi:ATP-dependent DNA helicase PIF1